MWVYAYVYYTGKTYTHGEVRKRERELLLINNNNNVCVIQKLLLEQQISDFCLKWSCMCQPFSFAVTASDRSNLKWSYFGLCLKRLKSVVVENMKWLGQLSYSHGSLMVLTMKQKSTGILSWLCHSRLIPVVYICQLGLMSKKCHNLQKRLYQMGIKYLKVQAHG